MRLSALNQSALTTGERNNFARCGTYIQILLLPVYHSLSFFLSRSLVFSLSLCLPLSVPSLYLSISLVFSISLLLFLSLCLSLSICPALMLFLIHFLSPSYFVSPVLSLCLLLCLSLSDWLFLLVLIRFLFDSRQPIVNWLRPHAVLVLKPAVVFMLADSLDSSKNAPAWRRYHSTQLFNGWWDHSTHGITRKCVIEPCNTGEARPIHCVVEPLNVWLHIRTTCGIWPRETGTANQRQK